MVKEEPQKQLHTEKNKETDFFSPPHKKPRNSEATPNSMPLHHTFLNSPINQSKQPPATTSLPAGFRGKTPPAKSSNNRINLTLTSQNVSDVSYSVKRSAPLKKILESYNEHHNLKEGSVKLLFDERYCQGHQTPDDLGLEDGDVLSVVGDQDGG